MLEPLIVTAAPGTPWHRLEILQWLERNTMAFKEYMSGGFCGVPHEYAAPLNSCYQSKKRINELLGIKETLR